MSTIYIKKTDGFAEIDKAFKKTGNTIIFEKGTYPISKTLYLNSNNTIIGNGAKLRQSGYIHNLVMSSTTALTTKYNGIHDVTIEGLEFEAMGGKYATKINLLTLWHANNITIKDCKFYDTYHFHAIEINGSANILIKKCEFLGYYSDQKNDFRECIQIDFSSESAIFLHKSGSKCYDGTHCKNVIVEDCISDKSAYRPGCSSFIGNHCQMESGYHENITVRNNKIKGFGTNANGYGIKLVSMKNVTIEGNEIEGYGRAILINNFATSYKANGNKVSSPTKSGCCYNVAIKNNKISNATGTFSSCGVFSESINGEHENITIESNEFEKSGTNLKFAYAIFAKAIKSLCIKNNDAKGKLKYSYSTCVNVISENNK